MTGPGKPDAGRKPGGEGLPYKDAAQVCGGPIDGGAKGGGLGEDYEVKGNPSQQEGPRGVTLKQQPKNGQEGSTVSKPKMRDIDESNY